MPSWTEWTLGPKQDEFTARHPEWATVCTSWEDPPGGGGPLSENVSATRTWAQSVSLTISFGEASAQLGVTYSESITASATYTFNLRSGERARVIYIPEYYQVAADTVETEWYQEEGIPPTVVSQTDHGLVYYFFPIANDGLFAVEYQYPIAYTDSRFQGEVVALPLRQEQYDWGSFPNDKISSLRVPNGYQVQVFADIHFSGANKTFGPGNYEVLFDWNDQISSMKVFWSG